MTHPSGTYEITSKALEQISTSTIYLMGGSFMLGCFFTLFLLLVLDFVRQKNLPPS